MKYLSTSASERLLTYARRGALLLALGGLGPAAFGQRFGPMSLHAAGPGSNPTNVALGDVNGDGRPDIVTANSGSNAVGVMLAISGGGFAPVATYSTGAYPVGVALGDVNLDGKLDIVTSHSTINAVVVLLGQTGGGFGPMSVYSTGASSTPYSVALGDVNADGRLDIVTANGFNTVGVLLGQASGFSPVMTYSAGPNSQPEEVVLGDVNLDGRLDIVTANYNSSSVGVLLGQAGGFGSVSTYSTGQYIYPTSVALGDVNADGRLDIVTAHSVGATVGATVGVMLGLSGGGFGPVSTYFSGISSPTCRVALGDVNGDGRPEIISTKCASSSLEIFLNQANSFGTPVEYGLPIGTSPLGLVIGDVNGDGRLDIVTANGSANTTGIFLNTGTYTPLATTRPATTADVSLFPNPAHGAFTVQLPATIVSVQAELLNALGQVVRRPVAVGTNFQVETSGLAPGIYTLRLHAGGVALARRVVVE